MSDKIYKLPYEIFPIYFDFSHGMVPDEVVIPEDVSVVCVNQATGADTKAQVIASQTLQGRRIQVVIKEGVLGEIHKITGKIHTNLDNILEHEVFLYIRKNPSDIDAFFKQPKEEYSIGNDFEDDLEPGEAVVSQSVLAIKKIDNSDASSFVIKGSGLDKSLVHLHVGIFNGADQEYYLLEMRLVTAMGYQYAKQVTMILKEL